MALTTLEAVQALRPEECTADYHIYRYRADYYKVVHFNSTAPRVGPIIRKPKDQVAFLHEDKLAAAISRARRVCFEYALCNEWKWFITLTISQANCDRKDLKSFYTRFKDWLKYQSKKLGKPIPYLLIPEQHGDGSWHMHGFFTDVIDPLLVSFRREKKAGRKIPYKLIKADYYNFPAYEKRFGFCSLGKIRDPIACAHYTVKYISKSFSGNAREVGLNLYYPSQGLKRASLAGSVYGPSAPLDAMLQHHYEFCSTGYVRYDREPGDDPILDIIEQQELEMVPMDIEDVYRRFYATDILPDQDPNSDDFYQICIADWKA